MSGRTRPSGVLILGSRNVVGIAIVLTALSPIFGGGPASYASSRPVNLLQGDQATFTTSSGGWGATNGSLQWLPRAGEGGGGALAVESTGTTSPTAFSGSPSAGNLTTATPGMLYTVGLSARVASGPQAVQTLIAFYDAAGNVQSGVWSSETYLSTGSWTNTAPDAEIAPPGTAAVALYVRVSSRTPGVVVLFADAWIRATPDRSAPVAGPLRTSGNRIIDVHGSPVTLRGVVLPGLDQSPDTTGVTQIAVDQAKAWGANVVRLPLGAQFWLSSNCDYSLDYRARVDQVVDWITALGMVALLELDTNTVGACEKGSPHNMADELQGPSFWSQVASRYASNPLVAFDLYNEPHDISDAVWLNGGTTTDFYPPHETYVAAGMQQLYDTVRSTGAQNLVFVTGNTWGDTVPSSLVNGLNIVYASHVYSCAGGASSSCSNPTPYDPSPSLDHWVGVSGVVPVMVTEFGWASWYDGTYNANVIAFADARGWGWSAFAWEQGDWSDWELATWLSDGTAEANPSGMPVLCALAAVTSGASPCAPPPVINSSLPPVATTTTSIAPATLRGSSSSRSVVTISNRVRPALSRRLREPTGEISTTLSDPSILPELAVGAACATGWRYCRRRRLGARTGRAFRLGLGGLSPPRRDSRSQPPDGRPGDL